VTKVVFIDTAYLVALTNASDGHHAEAKGLAQEWSKQRRSFVTTDAVMLEYANFFSRSPLRRLTATTVGGLRVANGWRFVAMDRAMVARGEARYAAHGDKAWSLTDCISMEVMIESKIDEVATTDAHFAQAGFRVLMRAPSHAAARRP
jgi:predicted nucleic acid-binding protein